MKTNEKLGIKKKQKNSIITAILLVNFAQKAGREKANRGNSE